MTALPDSSEVMRTKFGIDDNTLALRAWIKNPAHVQDLKDWLAIQGLNPGPIASYVEGGEHAELRRKIVNAFEINGGICGTGNY